jgi:hypothetical protein
LVQPVALPTPSVTFCATSGPSSGLWALWRLGRQSVFAAVFEYSFQYRRALLPSTAATDRTVDAAAA